ncbi:MAG: response regulator [Chitinivibrionales bacterium]|nr:response regulator [Chitinivibrionales bacterium]MBD3395011.1 response regulator [Chitinivibrionales bacterium]
MPTGILPSLSGSRNCWTRRMSSSIKAPNRTILVVDDEIDVLDFLTIYLESLSWNVVAVDSTRKAFEVLEREPCFCVLTDIAMPDMDGYEFIGEIKNRAIDIEMVLMTGFGYNPNHTLVKLNKSSHYPCLFKPFDRRKLADTIQAAYDRYHHGPDRIA